MAYTTSQEKEFASFVQFWTDAEIDDYYGQREGHVYITRKSEDDFIEETLHALSEWNDTTGYNDNVVIDRLEPGYFNVILEHDDSYSISNR